VTDEEFDIVAEGYDAGVRLREVIAQDMIAIPVSGDQRQLAVASPSTWSASARHRTRQSLRSTVASAGVQRLKGLPIAGNSKRTAARSTWL
jgi:hypothetical protein